MSEHEPAPRRYSEKEVGLILRRATELQRSEPSLPDPTGITLAELEDVAAEVGIDPRYLRRAAGELEAGGESTLWSRVLGAPLGFVIERTVPGELPESEFEGLVPLMQAATLGQGNASAVGRTLTWSSRSDTNTSSQQILVSSRDGETLIRVEERLGGFAGGLFGGVVGGGGVGVGVGVGAPLGAAAGSAVLAIGIPAVVVGGAYAACRAIYTAQVRKRRRRLADLLDRIADTVAEVAAQRALVEGEGQ